IGPRRPPVQEASMAREPLAEAVQVFGHRQALTAYVYAIVDGLPRRWRPPVTGVGQAPVVARRVHDLVLIASAVDAAPCPTPRAVARHDEVVSTMLGAEAVL